MPGKRIDESSWPGSGPHRRLLVLLADLHEKRRRPILQEVGDRTGLSTSQVSRLLTGKSFFSGEEQVRALVEALDGDEDERERAVLLYHRAAQARQEPPGRVSSADPRVLGVHPAIVVDDNQRRLPAYVERDTDTAPNGVRARLRALMRTGGLLVLVGSSSAGKTRTAYEAVSALVPKWRLVLPSGGLPSEMPPRSVVWLDELEQHLDDPAVESLLTAAPPVVLIGMMWPERHAAAAIARRPDGSPATGARILDRALTVWLADRFSDTEQRRAEHLAAEDVQIRVALEVGDYGVTQALAAAPQLMARVRGAGPIAAAVITAAVDAVRLGVRSPLPAGLLEAAAPAYCDARIRAKAPPGWLAAALAYATEELRGAAAVLTPVGADMGMVTGYRLADYVHQVVARERRNARPPGEAWQAFVATATDADDLERLAESAETRALYGHARDGYARLVDHLDPGTVHMVRYLSGGTAQPLRLGRSLARARLAALLARAGDMATLAQRAAHDDAADKVLADELFKRGDAEALSARAEAGSPAARGRLAALLAERDLPKLAALAEAGGAAAGLYLNQLSKAGRTEEVLAFMRRQAEQDPIGLPNSWWGMQLLRLEGDLDELIRRAERSVAPWAKSLLAQARAERGELQQLRDAADAGDESSALRLAKELDRRNAEDELRSRAERGDQDATRALAARQARAWLAAGDLESLRERAATDPWVVDTYADALAAVSDVDTLTELADMGSDRAARHAAELLARAGDLARLRASVDLGRPYAADSLADALAAAGRTDEAERLRRFGLRVDGEIALGPDDHSGPSTG